MAELTAGYLHLDYIKRKQIGYRDKLLYRINRLCLKILGCLSCIELYGGAVSNDSDDSTGVVSGYASSNWTTALFLFRRKKRQDTEIKSKTSTVTSSFVMGIYWLVNLYLLLNMYYQYSYDIYLVRHLRIRNLINNKYEGQYGFEQFEGQLRNTSEIVLELTKRVQETKKALLSVGAPYSHLTVRIEFIYMYFFLLTFIMYYGFYFFYRFIAPCRLSIIREQLDYEGELEFTQHLVEDRVTKFIASRKSFNEFSEQETLDRRNSLFGIYDEIPIVRKSSPVLTSSELTIGRKNDNFVSSAASVDDQILMDMMSSGALIPFNKSLNWFDLRSKLAFVHLTITIPYGLVYFSTLFRIAAPEFDSDRLVTLADYMVVSVTICELMFCFIPWDLLSSNYLFACLDQIVLINEMEKQIRLCILVNSAEFDRISSGVQSSRAQQQELDSITVVNKMKANLLFVLMHYKIFVAQIRPIIQTFNPVMVLFGALLLSVPIILKIHTPYLNLFEKGGIQTFAAATSIIAIIAGDSVLLPMCYFHCRCIKLYRTLSSLLAHSIEIESRPNGRGIYDLYSITALAKELRHSERYESQFTPYFVGYSLSYKQLLKLHFWWGLIALSTIFEYPNTGPGTIEILLSDPMRVF